MKKIMFFAFALCMALGATAQDEQRAAELFNQGKDLFDQYDKLFAESNLKNTLDETRSQRADFLLNGFGILQDALKADSIPDIDKKTGAQKTEKDGTPKFKTKNSKKIIDLLAGHFNDLGSIADESFNAHDYANAARGYDAFASLVDAPFAKKSNIFLPDTTKGMVRFYQAVSAYEVKDFKQALFAADQALSLGFKDPQGEMYYRACLSENVQPLVDEKNFDAALNILNNAIAKHPNLYYPYLVKGSVIENRDGIENAKALYAKVVEVDPTSKYGYFNLARCDYEKAIKIINDNPNATQKEIAALVREPLTIALDNFKKAQQLDPENETQVNLFIDDVNYKLEMFK